ncbi:hypothetical protein ColKHC_08028 [Colletotrichum higginsianum]|nr:hypothetical protein ColKHC_08028 [Colletotrichum higginsianum]
MVTRSGLVVSAGDAAERLEDLWGGAYYQWCRLRGQNGRPDKRGAKRAARRFQRLEKLVKKLKEA